MEGQWPGPRDAHGKALKTVAMVRPDTDRQLLRTPRDLRHTFATIMVGNDCNMYRRPAVRALRTTWRFAKRLFRGAFCRMKVFAG